MENEEIEKIKNEAYEEGYKKALEDSQPKLVILECGVIKHGSK